MVNAILVATLLAGGLLAAGCATSTPARSAQASFKASPDLAALQTRQFDHESKSAVFAAAHDVLRDTQYVTGLSDSSLGVLSATRHDVRKSSAPHGPLQLMGSAIMLTVGLPTLLAVASSNDGKDASEMVWPTKNHTPYTDRLALMVSDDGAAGKGCTVRVVIQREFPKQRISEAKSPPGSGEQIDGSWVVRDSAVYEDFFDRLARKLADRS